MADALRYLFMYEHIHMRHISFQLPESRIHDIIIPLIVGDNTS